MKSKEEIEKKLEESKGRLLSFQDNAKRFPHNSFWMSGVRTITNEIMTLEWVLNVNE